MDESELTAIEEIARASAAADDAEPLDEGAWRRLRHHGDELDVRVEPGAGFAITDGDLVHLVVAPDHRRGASAPGCWPTPWVTAQARGMPGRTATTRPRQHSRVVPGSSAYASCG